MVVFTIEKHYIDDMIAHARREAPIECCGVLGGKDGRVLKLYQATNAEQSRYCYNIEPQELFRINQECEENGWQFLAIYHSHPDSAAYPSPTDVRLAALWPESLYFIVSLLSPENPEVRAFRIRDGVVTEEKIEIV
ncbi:MAG: M67 family metallopeptidase [Dehalococcoidia bacterium]|nr:MAG: M67 family metallopeptidase [Dehalococcoidia bacterium]